MEAEPKSHESHDASWSRFLVVIFLFTFGFYVYNGVFQNYLRESLGAGPMDLGRLEALRETPGLLAALTAGILAALAETRLAALGLLICAIGIGLTGDVGGYWGVVAISVFWSIGFHLYSAMSPSITMQLAQEGQSGFRLGLAQRAGSLGTLLALGLAFGISIAAPQVAHQYRVFYWSGGIAIFACAVICLGVKLPGPRPIRARFIVRREYSLYYLLTFLEGCRRQIFSIFASFALIRVYGADLKTMLALQLTNAVLLILIAPRIGKWIDHIGVRKPLMIYGMAMVVIFALYALIPVAGILMALFVIDSMFFSFSSGFNVYLRQIVRPNELTPCVSMGVTMNHVAAVSLPVLGAWLWQTTGNYQVPFWVGTALAMVSVFATARLPEKVQAIE